MFDYAFLILEDKNMRNHATCDSSCHIFPLCSPHFTRFSSEVPPPARTCPGQGKSASTIIFPAELWPHGLKVTAKFPRSMSNLKHYSKLFHKELTATL